MPPPLTEPMAVEQGALLTDFARTCKAAARAVSLYPGTHPAIAALLSRLVAATGRLTRDGPVKFAIHRDLLAIDGRAPLRPDPSIGELATLLHERLIGRLTIQPEADADDWRTLLLLLARAPDDLITSGGIGQAWTGTGRTHFEIREIDYAEVLRERGGGEADWDRIIAYCLQGEGGALDEGIMASLLEALDEPARFAMLLEQLQQAPAPDGTKVGARVGALLQLMRTAIDAARTRGEAEVDRGFETIAASCSSLTPEMMLAMLERRESTITDEASLMSHVVERMTDDTLASFMARSVARERGSAERLAEALHVLVPSQEQKAHVVELAKAEALESALGEESGFEQLWANVANTVMSYSMLSYSDNSWISEQYGKELSGAKKQAIDVERVSDDPPERIQAWIATVTDSAVEQLDLEMILDLLRLQGTPEQWEPIAVIAASEIERRTLAGDIAGAHSLIEALVRETKADGRAALHATATKAVDHLGAGPIARHVALHFRTIIDEAIERFNQLCQLIGPSVVRSLADALAREENAVAIRRLGNLLLSFGTAGRRSVEQLKNSPNPAVRRTAVTLLRRAGGQEALLELASMMGDDDPDVQRESIHAIVEIGNANAYSVLHRLLLEADTPRDSALRELIGLRNDKAVPLFSYVLAKGEPRGKLIGIHLSIIEALGTMKPRPESIRALQQVLLRGNWRTPFRTAAQRQAAATALRRLGTPEALAVLEAAITSGGRGVRRIAKSQVALFQHRERNRA
ncbi:MAG TPA: HEAT repeat domain-containing protein [Vicinamibacterales bacterium]|nr:HEAT repeat domain-containing protein [Vicinamibacterales bacterium]